MSDTTDIGDALPPDYFERLCDSVSFAVIAADNELRIRFWNVMANRLFGARAERMLGQPLIGVFPESVRADAQRVIEAAIREGVAADLEFAFRDPAQRPLYLTAVVSPIHGKDGSRLGVSVGLRDITLRRALTRQLSQERRLASLGKMAGGVADSFNNTLGGALARIQLIQQDARLASRHQRDLKLVHDSIDRSVRVSRLLMLYADGDPDPGTPRPLVDIVRDYLGQLEPELRPRDIHIETALDEVRPAKAPERCMRDILHSILQNSIDAMPTGGHIRVSLSKDDTWALLSITDTGPGIDAEKLVHIFEPFFTTKSSQGGGAGKSLGLSLSVVQKFIHDMGGRIDVSSPPGQGARFDIRLPIE